jgi:hypothetical protein
MTSCYCENPAEVYWATRPLSRTAHRCDECGRQIQHGERYERVRAVWDGKFQTYLTCVYCLGVRDSIEAVAQCFCWYHGNMLEDAKEWVRDEAYRIPGLAMRVGRWIVEGKRDRGQRALQ